MHAQVFQYVDLLYTVLIWIVDIRQPTSFSKIIMSVLLHEAEKSSFQISKNIKVVLITIFIAIKQN